MKGSLSRPKHFQGTAAEGGLTTQLLSSLNYLPTSSKLAPCVQQKFASSSFSFANYFDFLKAGKKLIHRDLECSAYRRADRFASFDGPTFEFADDAAVDRFVHGVLDVIPTVNQAAADDDARKADSHDHVRDADAEEIADLFQRAA